MALGLAQPQARFESPRDLLGDRLRQGSIYRLLADEGARIFPDDYFPSAAYGVNDPVLGNYLTSTFTVPAGASSKSNLPVATAVATVGEVFVWFNTSKFQFRLSASPRYQFGLWGFYPAADSTKVVARTHAACNLVCLSPRHQKAFYGIAA